MLRFLRQLFGRKQTAAEVRPDRSVGALNEASIRPRENRISTSYYDSMSKMQQSISRKEFNVAARFVHESVRQIPGWVKETREEFGLFDIGSIPAIQDGGRVLALLGDDEGLAEMRQAVAAIPDLEPWLETIDQHQKDRGLFVSILAAVKAQPGCLQSDVKDLVGEVDGRRVAVLISYLERSGKLARIKAGRTYRLVPADSPAVSTPMPKRVVASHRADRTPPRLHEIDVTNLAYVPLPRSPLRWEETQAGRERAKVTEANAHFEVRDADWRITSVDKIPLAERPDPAFHQMYPRDSGLLLVDPVGKAEGLGRIEAAGMCYDRAGKVTAKVGMNHGVYRVGVHPLGRGMIAMSRDGVLHAYDDDLKPIIQTSLADAPEIRAIRKRFEIDDDELKNHIRCVALSRYATRYLFTVVDEAWCIGADGTGLWGAKLPIKDGWTRVATPSSGFGTCAEVDQALGIMGLTLPVTPDGLKQRYRDLAKQWHPDLNPNDSQAVEKMKALNVAAEVLTGVDATTLPQYAGGAFVRELDRREIDVHGHKMTLTMRMQISERFASDWIYAASFAGNSDSVFLAGYSGRVVLVDENGLGVRVYDIGAVPRRIVDTGRYLYLLTDTRLYVLREDALHSLIDMFDGGDLIVTQNGFALLEKKRLRWYSADGMYVGSVLTSDPIRRVYCTNDHVVVETRQLRASIEGAPDWWA